MSKQDRVAPRTATDIERKYNFGKSFAEVMGIAEDARDVAEEAKNAASKPAEKLTHDEVFNLLTQNGTLQGLYRGDDGELYINAEYIKAGVLSADVVRLAESTDARLYFSTLEELDSFVLSAASILEVNERKTLSATFDGCFSGMCDDLWGFGSLEISTGVDADGFKRATAVVEINVQVAYNDIYSEGVDEQGRWDAHLTGWRFISSPNVSFTPNQYDDLMGVECYYRDRYDLASNYYEREWVNPPMELNTEYRTIERHMGQPVYTKLIDCGIPANDAYVPTGLKTGSVIRFAARMGTIPLPLQYPSALESYNVNVNITDITAVNVQIGANATVTNIYCQLWYIK